jgi:hypothetical protein
VNACLLLDYKRAFGVMPKALVVPKISYVLCLIIFLFVRSGSKFEIIPGLQRHKSHAELLSQFDLSVKTGAVSCIDRTLHHRV